MIAWSVQPVSPPAAEPLNLADAKNFARVSSTDDDLEVRRLIAAARIYAENVTARALVQTQYLLTLDRFPFPSNYDRALYSQDQFIPIGPTNMPFYDQFAIRLPRNPVVSIDAVKYIDNAGVLQTLDPSQYEADLVSQQARLLPAFGIAWPIARYQANAVQITFTAGSMFPASVDAGADTITMVGPAPLLADGRGLSFYAAADPAAAAAQLAAPLQAATTYYAINTSGQSCQLAAAPAGSPIDLTAAPVGVMLAELGAGLPAGIRSALLLLVALHYEARAPGSVDLMAGLNPVNALLDQERIWNSDAGGGGT